MPYTDDTELTMSYLKEEVNKRLTKVKSGGVEEFRKLYDFTYCHLRTVAYMYAAEKADCDDIVNDAFYKIYKYAPSFDESCDGYNWMCRIVQRCAYDHNAKKGYTQAFDDEVAATAVQDDGFDRFFARELVSRLDENEKSLVVDYYWYGYTLEEMAAKRKISVAKAYRDLKKIIKKLKKYV